MVHARVGVELSWAFGDYSSAVQNSYFQAILAIKIIYLWIRPIQIR